MPMQILNHTPLFVWAILAFLIFRGVLSMRAREVDVRKLFIIPVVMVALALQDIVTRYGMTGAALAAWAGAAALTAWAIVAFTRTRIEAGATPGSLRLRGSWVPLAAMLAVFVTKYTVIVSMIVHPQLRNDAPFVVAACAASGLCSGFFVGCLLRDLKASMLLRSPVTGAVPAR